MAGQAGTQLMLQLPLPMATAASMAQQALLAQALACLTLRTMAHAAQMHPMGLSLGGTSTHTTTTERQRRNARSLAAPRRRWVWA